MFGWTKGWRQAPRPMVYGGLFTVFYHIASKPYESARLLALGAIVGYLVRLYLYSQGERDTLVPRHPIKAFEQ